MALHEVGSSNPDGIEIKQQPKDPATGLYLDGIYSHPYYTIKDLVGVVVFLAVFSAIMFFMPEMGGYFLEANNFIPADPLKTPEHIAPVWYFTPYYAILRAVPSFFDSQFPGVLAMGVSVVIFFFLPWLDRGAVKSIRYRGTLYKSWLAAFVISFVILGYLGVVPVTVWGQFPDSWPILGGADKATVVARILTVVYFLFFLLMPWYTRARQDQAGSGKGRLKHEERSPPFPRRCCCGAAGARARRPAAPICASIPRRSTGSTPSRCSAARATSSTTASTATARSTCATSG